MSVLSTTERQLVHANEPTFTDRGPGIDLPAKLDKAAGVGGMATVLTGQTSVTVTAAALGGSYGGKPVQLTPMANLVDATWWASWSGDDLVISIGTAEAGDVAFSYHVFTG